MNQVVICGTVSNYIKPYNVGTEKECIKFSIATRRPVTNVDGTKSWATDWHNVVAFKNKVAASLVAGDTAIVTGKLIYDKVNNHYHAKIIAEEVQKLGKVD